MGSKHMFDKIIIGGKLIFRKKKKMGDKKFYSVIENLSSIITQ